MRPLFMLLVLAGFSFASCKKDEVINPIDTRLAGQWEMISARDNSTNEVFTKPASVPENIDIIISFTSSARGKISGALTIATSVSGNFSIDQNSGITIPSVSLIYPPFDIFWGSASWDQQFSDNITLSHSYSFESSGNLDINCSNNKILTFARK
jgi:hypothetical protein